MIITFVFNQPQKNMRLGQLARKLDIRPTQIVSFLKKEHTISVDDSLNSKIEDDVLELVMAKFKIDTPKKVIQRAKKSIIQEEPIIEEKPINLEEIVEEEEVQIDIEQIIDAVTKEVANEIFEDEAIDEAIDNIVIDELKTVEEIVEVEQKEESPTENLTAYDEDGEPIELTVVDGVIKAPKKELEGFKVVGKIDLPQKAKPISFIITKNGESTDITETIEQTRIDLAKHKREKYLARVEKRKLAAKNSPSKSKRSLSEMDIREKQNKLAVEKQIQLTKAKKEQKKKYYEQNKKTVTKAPKKKKNTGNKGGLKDMKTYDKEPTTRWGKIWKWFNT